MDGTGGQPTSRPDARPRTEHRPSHSRIEVRKELTDEWKRTGVKEGLEYASLTDIITREWSGFTTKQYKHYKGLKKENLRDNMTNLEIALNILAEASATEISKDRDPKGFNAQTQVARERMNPNKKTNNNENNTSMTHKRNCALCVQKYR